ncbi:MAG TPA: polysaccharide deacetylase family protein [Thermoleophilaceae bacterium]|nr:polysaccharide deacetylase family protein [Thermoleophilaceae bacterium]
MPSFGEHLQTLARWREFPALERLEDERVALTFDDGPDPEGTPGVLDALDAADLKATFFMVGEQVKAAPALAREVATRGHEVALHGATHRPHSELSPRDSRDEPAYGLGTLEAATGRRPRWFRPPYGVFNEHSYEAVRGVGLEPVYWSAWGMDWETISAERILDIVERDLAAGAILVLHDSARYGHRPDVAATIAAIPLIAAAAAERGLQLGPL